LDDRRSRRYEEWDVGTDCCPDDRQGSGRVAESQQVVQRNEHGTRVAAATTETRTRGDAFRQVDANLGNNTGRVQQGLGGAPSEIGRIAGYSRLGHAQGDAPSRSGIDA
jgi:hypothetical protein